MRKIISVTFSIVILLLSSVFGYGDGDQQGKELTLMVYMCGSNLESQNNCATRDKAEMQYSGLNTDAVNLILLTGGSEKTPWNELKCQRLLGNSFRPEPIPLSPAGNMGDPETLAGFISYSFQHYPAKEYALILWDHGEGPLGHLCIDEQNENDGLSIAELTEALIMARLPKKLSWVGFDACLMSSVEVACAIAPYAEYMIASQETEPGNGWLYGQNGEGFLKGIEADQNGAETGRRIIDSYFEGNKGINGLTLSCLDLSKVQNVSNEMGAFFERFSEMLDDDVFSSISKLRKSSTGFGEVIRSVDNGYDLVDLKSLAEQFGQYANPSTLVNAVEEAVVASRTDMEDTNGVSVYHPYYNKEEYLRSRKNLYQQLPFSDGYRHYVQMFGMLLTGETMADWKEIRLNYDGFFGEAGHQFSMRMTPEQKKSYASAQLIILGALGTANSDRDVYEGQFLSDNGADQMVECYYPVWVSSVSETEGLLHTEYTSRSLYMTDESGTPIAGPIAYRMSDDGSLIYVFTQYLDNSGRENSAPTIRVLYTCTEDEKTGELSVVKTEVFDTVTKSYTQRLTFKEEDYTTLFVDRLARCVPESDGALPAFADWIAVRNSSDFPLPLCWNLRFFDAQLSGTQLYATLQVTDTQQNSYCTPLIPLNNPNLYDIELTPVSDSGGLSVYAKEDHSPLGGGLNIWIEGKQGGYYDTLLINNRDVSGSIEPIDLYDRHLQIVHIDETELYGVERIDSIRLSDARGVEEVAYQVYNCEPNFTYKLPYVPISGSESAGESWQLMSLTLNAQGDMEGVLHIRNDTDRRIERDYNVVVNNQIQTDMVIPLIMQAHTECYRRIIIKNRAELTDFQIDGLDSQSYYFINHLLQRNGIAQVNSLQFIEVSEEPSEPISLVLPSPIDIGHGENDTYSSEGADFDFDHLLLNDDILVNLEQIVLGHQSIGLLLTLKNTLERDVFFEITNTTIDGQLYYDDAETTDRIALKAGSVGVMSLRIRVKNMLNTVSEIGLAFRYDGFTSTRAYARLDKPAAFNTEGGIVISGEQLVISKTAQGRPKFIIDDHERAVGDSVVSLSLIMTNLTDNSTPAEDCRPPLFAQFSASVSIENRSAENLEYHLDHFVLNDSRCMSASYRLESLGKGESTALQLDFEWDELCNLKEVSSICCDLRVAHKNGLRTSEERFTLRWEIQKGQVEGLVPVAETMGFMTGAGAEWELLSINSAQSYEVGDLNFRFLVKNPEDQELSFTVKAVSLEGLVQMLRDSHFTLPAHREKMITVSYPNWVDSYSSGLTLSGAAPSPTYPGGLLQSCGIKAIRTVLMHLKQADGKDEPCVMTLGSPWELPKEHSDGDKLTLEMMKNNYNNRQSIIDGEAEVSVSYIRICDNGIQMTLNLINHTMQTVQFTVSDPWVQDMPVKMAGRSEFTVFPNCTRIVDVGILFPESYNPSTLKEAVNFSITAGDVVYKDIGIRIQTPFQPERGGLYSAHQIIILSGKNLTGEQQIYEDFDPDLFPCELGILPYKRGRYQVEDVAITDFSRFIPGNLDLKDLNELDYYVPALRIYNNSGEDTNLSLWAVVNGEEYHWDQSAFIEKDGNYVAYIMLTWEYGQAPSAGRYDCVFYAGETRLYSGTVQVTAEDPDDIEDKEGNFDKWPMHNGFLSSLS